MQYIWWQTRSVTFHFNTAGSRERYIVTSYPSKCLRHVGLEYLTVDWTSAYTTDWKNVVAWNFKLACIVGASYFFDIFFTGCASSRFLLSLKNWCIPNRNKRFPVFLGTSSQLPMCRAHQRSLHSSVKQRSCCRSN